MKRRIVSFLAIVIILSGTPASALAPADIDAYLAEAQESEEVEPSALADDATFFRRLSLDIRGVVPSLDESLAFLRNESEEKRIEAIEEFLLSEERGDHWGNYWDKVLLGTLDQPERPEAQWRVKQSFRDWVAQQVNDNVPFDQFMRAIVDAHGPTNEEPQALPLARWNGTPESMAGTITRAFLGEQIQCAQCHDHKTNKDLTQQKFWEFAAFFASTRSFPIRNAEMDGQRTFAQDVRDVGFRWKMEIPDRDPQVTVSPVYLDGTPANRLVIDENGNPINSRQQLQEMRRLNQARRKIRETSQEDRSMVAVEMQRLRDEMPYVHDTRRRELARLMLENDREQFAANIVNRVWARYFGRGLLEPVDGWLETTPDHPDLLSALAQYFIETGYNLCDLERLILQTEAYQRSSVPTKSSEAYPELFAHASLRPLSPSQLLASLVQATNADPSSAGRALNQQRLSQLREIYSAQFIHTFGNDEMEWTNTFETSIPRALFLLNDKGINAAVDGSFKNSLVSDVERKAKDPAAQVDLLFMAVFSRPASQEENAYYSEIITQERRQNAKEGREVMEDVLWSLLNSTEFLLNH